MTREDIIQISEKHFDALGFRKDNVDENTKLFWRTKDIGLGKDEILIHFHKKGEQINQPLLTRLASSHTDAERFFVTDYPLGLVPEVVKKSGFTYQVPVFLFDREFRTDTVKTPLKQFITDIKKYADSRVKQPYKTETNQGIDLLDDLVEELNNVTSPSVRFIVAPAGYGKTVLMSSLYGKLYDRFYECKKKQEIAMRPLIMLPGHLRGARVEDMDDLIRSFINTEYFYGATNEQIFDLWVNNNFAIWLLDGLEELILKDPDRFLFDIMENYLTNPESKNPQIVISIREPLLSACPQIKEFIEEWNYATKVYNLLNWDNEQISQYFTKNLKPTSYLTQNDINSFILETKSSKVLNNLCRTPYYCFLVSDLRMNGELPIVNDELELVNYAFEKICEREYDKGLDKEVLPLEKQKELFAELALEGWGKKEMPSGILSEYAELILPEGLSENIKNNHIACLERHSVISSLKPRIYFTHDIVEQYLISIAIQKRLHSKNYAVLDSNEIDYDSFILKYLSKNAEYLSDITSDDIVEFLDNTDDRDFGFRNILKLVLTTSSTPGATIKSFLAGVNLTGIKFHNMNLANTNFKSSNLTLTEFINCNLQEACFDSCCLKDTYFDSKSNLANATFQCKIAESIKTENKTIADRNEINRFIFERTKISPTLQGPCQATINLRKVFEKFTKRGKGTAIPQKFVFQTKCGGGIPAEKCVEECLKKGYLLEEGVRLKARISSFGEIEKFVKEWKASPFIYDILSKICRNSSSGCEHTTKA